MDVFREKKEWILVWPFQFFFLLFVFLIWGEKGESVKKKKKRKSKEKRKIVQYLGLGSKVQ